MRRLLVNKMEQIAKEEMQEAMKDAVVVTLSEMQKRGAIPIVSPKPAEDMTLPLFSFPNSLSGPPRVIADAVPNKLLSIYSGMMERCYARFAPYDTAQQLFLRTSSHHRVGVVVDRKMLEEGKEALNGSGIFAYSLSPLGNRYGGSDEALSIVQAFDSQRSKGTAHCEVPQKGCLIFRPSSPESAEADFSRPIEVVFRPRGGCLPICPMAYQTNGVWRVSDPSTFDYLDRTLAVASGMAHASVFMTNRLLWDLARQGMLAPEDFRTPPRHNEPPTFDHFKENLDRLVESGCLSMTPDRASMVFDRCAEELAEFSAARAIIPELREEFGERSAMSPHQ